MKALSYREDLPLDNAVNDYVIDVLTDVVKNELRSSNAQALREAFEDFCWFGVSAIHSVDGEGGFKVRRVSPQTLIDGGSTLG